MVRSFEGAERPIPGFNSPFKVERQPFKGIGIHEPAERGVPAGCGSVRGLQSQTSARFSIAGSSTRISSWWSFNMRFGT